MRSKEIGNSRQTEKRLLRDMEVFSSPQFLRLVQRIGKEITDKHDAQIRFYSDVNGITGPVILRGAIFISIP